MLNNVFNILSCDLYLCQVEALRQGLLKVVPQAVLDLLTWQELERRVCGDPTITVEDLKKTSKFTLKHVFF